MSAEQASDVYACVVCKEEIAPGARKCKHCDSRQHWFPRFLQFLSLVVPATVVVAAALALFGAWGSLFPSSQTHYALAQSWVAIGAEERLNIIAVNDGQRPARVLQAHIVLEAPASFRLPEHDDDRTFDYHFSPQDDGLVGPGENKLLRFEGVSWDPRSRFLESFDAEWSCALTITEVDSNGRVHRRDIDLAGDPVRLPPPHRLPPSMVHCERVWDYARPRIRK